MKWYLNLNVNQKINFKYMYKMIIGFEFEDLSFMLSFRERIELGYNKLVMEGFDI